MRRNKILFTLSMVLVLSLLAIALPAVPVLAAVGTITLSPASGIVGTLVTLTGTGFTTPSNYTVMYDATSLPGGAVSATGTIYTTFNIQPSARGAHNVTVTTSAGDTSNTATFTITPDIVLGTTSGYGGDQLGIAGTGFAASTTVNITFDGTTIGSAVTGTNGSFSGITVPIPQTYRGAHTITGNDGAGASPSYTFSVSPKITLSPPSAAIGSPLTISGVGFTANSPISFYIDEVNISATATSASNLGSFTLSNFIIPAISYGNHVLKAMDSGGGSATANFSTTQSMSINPQSGTAGASVQISGQGFGANKNIVITFKGVNVQTNPPTVTSDASGNFSASLTVPAAGGGTNPIVASDGTISSTANFSVAGTANISANKGTVGTSATVSGGGFTAGGSVMVRWDATQLTQVNADANGAFSAAFKVPPSKAGDHMVTVTDGSTTKTFTFNVAATASLGQTTGNVGSDVPISGTGFTAGANVTISYDGNKIANTTVDANGNFTAAFKAPASKGGSHTIAATDGTNTINSTFTMETTPPPVPLLIKPLNDIKGESLQDFIWTGVSDPSGVTYAFQLATDTNFSTMVLEKTDMTNPGYKITEKEELKSRSQKEPYYWRVKAIDGASNDSGWSPPYSFYVGFIMPEWGLYAIAGVVAVLVFMLGFWLGKSSGRARLRDSIIY